jgi:hypothetical protein
MIADHPRGMNTSWYNASGMKIKLGTSRLKLLRALAACGVLTKRQAGYICFNLKAKPHKDVSVSHTWAERMLNEMADDGLVWRDTMDVKTHADGRSPYLFGLKPLGVKIVQECYDLPTTLKPLSAAERDQKLGNLHDLVTNDVLIAAARATELGLREWKHGRTLRQELVDVPAVPDGYLRFPKDTIFLEVDNSGKETERVWKAKVHNLIEALDGPNLTPYWQDRDLVIAVVVVKGEGRRDRLRQWTVEAAPDEWAYFLFTDVLPTDSLTTETTEPMPPLAYFTEKHWYYPGEPEPRALLTS